MFLFEEGEKIETFGQNIYPCLGHSGGDSTHAPPLATILQFVSITIAHSYSQSSTLNGRKNITSATMHSTIKIKTACSGIN